MAEFELNIYGNDDEVLKKYATNKVRWGIFLQALELQESMKNDAEELQLSAINDFVKKIFPELTDEDLCNADISDVISTFHQLLSKANKIGGNIKNAVGVEPKK